MEDSQSRDGSGKKRVRTACVSCRRRKIRCDGGFPCEQCLKVSYTCEYDGQPAKRTAAHHAYEPICAAEPEQLDSMPRELTFNGVSFGSKEMQHINVYLDYLDASFPTVPYSMLRDGVNSASLELLGFDDTARLHASKAASWAAAALGASFSDVSLAQDYMAASIRNMRQCFEVPNEESVMAYALLGTACFQLGRPELFYRYVEFADALEESMPTMSSHAANALALSRARVFWASNKARFNPKATILPPLEEIYSMDLRVQILFLDQLWGHKIEEFLYRDIVTEEKVRVCREIIDLVSPLLEQLESDPQYRKSKASRMMLYIPLGFFWAICGDREKSLVYLTRLVEVLEENICFQASPEIVYIRAMVPFLIKLGAFELQRRFEAVFDAGAKYVIWTPPRSADLDLLLSIEALVDELQQTSTPQSLSPIAATTSFEGAVPLSALHWSELEFAVDFLDDLDEFNDCNHLVACGFRS